MKILEKPIAIKELEEIASGNFFDLVKGVVDIKREIMAIDAQLHSDLEALLLEAGSKQEDLWGINLYPALKGDDFIEFDSMINIRPWQKNISRSVENKKTQEEIIKIINKWIKDGLPV